MKAMILAAGFGTRLLPYTLKRPKPLFPVLDRPLLLRILSQLRGAGIAEVVVNANHLREQIVALLHDEPGVFVQQETAVLGTGGGLRLASRHFEGAPFLVVNGDIVHNIDLAAVYRAHLQSGAAVSMVLHDCPRFNTVRLGRDRRVAGFGAEKRDPAERLFAFTGIQVINPEVLELIPQGVFFHSIDCYAELIRRGGDIHGILVEGHFWTDMGTVADYLDLHRVLLTGSTPTGIAAEPQDRPFFLGEGVELGQGVQFADWVAIGSGARICAGARLSRVVIWDGVRVPAGIQLVDTIVNGEGLCY